MLPAVGSAEVAGVAVATGLVTATVGLTALGSVGVSVLVTEAVGLSGLGSVVVVTSVAVAVVVAVAEAAGLAVVVQLEPDFQLHPH